MGEKLVSRCCPLRRRRYRGFRREVGLQEAGGSTDVSHSPFHLERSSPVSVSIYLLYGEVIDEVVVMLVEIAVQGDAVALVQ